MIGNEIEKHNQFRQQSVPILSQIEGPEIETAHKSVVSPFFPPIKKVHPELGQHLDTSIHLGLEVSYSPNIVIDWLF
jgi:hypothetical protein